MYAISPAGMGLDALWSAVRDGKPCGGPITTFDCSRNSAWIAAQVPDFDMTEWEFPHSETAHLDRATQFALVAADRAVGRSGLDPFKMNPYRAGVCIGTAIGGVDSMERAFAQLCAREPEERKKPRRVNLNPNAADPRLWSSYSAHSVSHEVA